MDGATFPSRPERLEFRCAANPPASVWSSRLRVSTACSGICSERLARLADPRRRRGKRHTFVSVLLIACLAVLCGAARSRRSASGPVAVHRRMPWSVSAPAS
ncbi:transposase family protein [Streptomyces sp. NBC_00503]|uniref:transposase family protein n=1 Tax=Streptomyces sp. NBC_00503 TaxID=2903659 RepID=UPI003FCD1C5D